MKTQTKSVFVTASFLIGWLFLPTVGRTEITSVSITPEEPTPQEAIVFTVEGWLPNTCWAMEGFDFYQTSPNSFAADLDAVDLWVPGMVCLEVLVPYQYSATLGPLNPGTYSIFVTEFHRSVSDSFPWPGDIAELDFAVIDQFPYPFSLLSPTSGDTCWTLDTLLVWENTTDPDTFNLPFYDVWLDTLPNLSSAWLLADSIADTSFEIANLLDDHIYYWTVRATDSNTPGTWADDTLMFHTYYPETPSSFALIEPMNGTETAWNPITFRWTDCVDPDPGDSAAYTLTLIVESDSVSLGDISGTTIELDPDTMSILEGGAIIVWHVTAHTDYPNMMIESQSRFSFTLLSSATETVPSIIPQDYYLSQNYPNPFNPSTTIEFGLPKASSISIGIYDIIGREVDQIVSGSIPEGHHSIIWNCSTCSSGIYLIVLETPEFKAVKKAMFLR